MSAIDVQALLEDVDPLEPCGPDLEYDPTFGEMERSAEGRPEQQYGDTVIPAVEPDWKEVRSHALEVAGRSRDLRVIPYLARAMLRTDGFEGFKDSLELLRGYVEQQWEFVHPQLDPDDDNDPTLRVNVLKELCDPVGTLKLVREAPLVNSRALGVYSLRDLAVASGEISPAPGEEAPALSTIDGAFMEVDADELTATSSSIDIAIEHVRSIEDMVTDHVPAGEGPDLSPLADMLRDAGKIVGQQLAARGLDDPGAESGAGSAGDEGDFEGGGESAGAIAQGRGTRVPIQGELVTRDDVSKMLIKCSEWFERYEPSSPVPILLRRANRLISKDFLEVLRDLAPDGVHQAELFRGENSDDDNGLI